MFDITKFSPAPVIDIGEGMQAVTGGLLFLQESRSIVAADIHFGYEEVIGGALPLWSIDESFARIREAVQRVDAREIILLGDVIHGSLMSDRSMERIDAALRALRALGTLTIIAGNHEGRCRGAQILGDTHEVIERDGRLLLHGDEIMHSRRCIIGHLHPSLHLGGGKSAPVFLASASLVVVPALTPYSPGLNVCSSAAAEALRPWLAAKEVPHVYGVAGKLVYPFGALDSLCAAHAARTHVPWERRRRFRR